MSKQGDGRTIGRPFVKGQVANPRGRPPGMPDRRTRYRELIEGHMPELIQRCVDMALQGDVQALRLCLERVLPAVRPGDEMVSLPFDPADGMGAQARSVVRAAFDGQISPSAASTLITAIAGQARVIETDELARRVEALETASVIPRHDEQ